jgi:hypothetical protein
MTTVPRTVIHPHELRERWTTPDRTHCLTRSGVSSPTREWGAPLSRKNGVMS